MWTELNSEGATGVEAGAIDIGGFPPILIFRPNLGDAIVGTSWYLSDISPRDGYDGCYKVSYVNATADSERVFVMDSNGTVLVEYYVD